MTRKQIGADELLSAECTRKSGKKRAYLRNGSEQPSFCGCQRKESVEPVGDKKIAITVVSTDICADTKRIIIL